MDENKKICPFCGAEINIEAKKCRFCNNWIDEEVKCPYCAETIKASAKKCRFCGEWLNKNLDECGKKEANIENINELIVDAKKEELKPKNKDSKRIKLLILMSILIIFLSGSIVGFIMYIPACDNANIQSKVKEYLISNYSNIGGITFDLNSVNKLNRIEKGYNCSMNAKIDNTSTHIEYSYKKVAFNEYDISAKFVLPNCFDSSVKVLLADLIKKYDYYNIKDNTDYVYTTNEAQNNYDKDSNIYSCTGDATLTSKPGKAYLLTPWDYDNASRTIDCNIDYKTYFCNNGYTTCVELNSLYSCNYKD
jgi:hypothetical protein